MAVRSERVEHLREQSVNTKPYISMERAELLTSFYEEGTAKGHSTPVARALAFKHLMEKNSISISDGELIVGERGPEPRATPTFPELCCHSLEDLEIMNSRERTPFRVDEETRSIQEEQVIPFWRGKTMRERVFVAMTPEWHEAFSAGVFTEFMEQRAPGHAVLDDKIYRKGMLDFKREIEEYLGSLDFQDDPEAHAKQQELKAMGIAADALVALGKRYSKLAEELAGDESDPLRREELEKIAQVCDRVPARAPRDFWEALQMYWFCHLGVGTELNTWDSFDPGRLDQHLIGF